MSSSCPVASTIIRGSQTHSHQPLICNLKLEISRISDSYNISHSLILLINSQPTYPSLLRPFLEISFPAQRSKNRKKDLWRSVQSMLTASCLLSFVKKRWQGWHKLIFLSLGGNHKLIIVCWYYSNPCRKCSPIAVICSCKAHASATGWDTEPQSFKTHMEEPRQVIYQP